MVLIVQSQPFPKTKSSDCGNMGKQRVTRTQIQAAKMIADLNQLKRNIDATKLKCIQSQTEIGMQISTELGLVALAEKHAKPIFTEHPLKPNMPSKTEKKSQPLTRAGTFKKSASLLHSAENDSNISKETRAIQLFAYIDKCKIRDRKVAHDKLIVRVATDRMVINNRAVEISSLYEKKQRDFVDSRRDYWQNKYKRMVDVGKDPTIIPYSKKSSSETHSCTVRPIFKVSVNTLVSTNKKKPVAAFQVKIRSGEDVQVRLKAPLEIPVDTLESLTKKYTRPLKEAETHSYLDTYIKEDVSTILILAFSKGYWCKESA